MKVWIRDRQGNEMIASLDKPDGEVKLWIAPTEDDPAELIASSRSDGYEQVVWDGAIHLVQSIDLDFEPRCEYDLAGTDYCTCNSQEMTDEDIALENAGL